MKSKILLLVSLMVCVFSFSFGEEDGFGGFAISKKLYLFIKRNVKKGSTILELGSGWGSQTLSKRYRIYSVEHNKRWVNKYDTNYIYARIKNNWYDTKILKAKLPKDYNVLLVDGPPQKFGRAGILDNLELFNLDAMIIFDDVQRPAEYEVMQKISAYVNRPFEIHQCEESPNSKKRKAFGVILPKES